MNESNTKPAGLFARAAAFIGRHKKAALLLAAVLAVGGFAAARLLPARAAKAEAGIAFVRTTTLHRTTLENAVSATGTVESAGVSGVTTDLKYTVKSVAVQVGDTVQAGDVICTLDTAELEKQIERARESLSDSAERLQESFDKAQESYNDAAAAYDEAAAEEEARETGYRAAWDVLSAAMSRITWFEQQAADADAALEQALAAHNAALTAQSEAQRDLDAITAALSAARAEQTAAQAALDAADPAADRTAEEETLAAATAKVTALEAEEVSAQTDVQSAQAEAAAAEADYKAAQDAQKTAAAELKTAQTESGYTEALAAKNAAVTAWEQSQAALEKAEAQAKTTAEALEDAREALAEGGDSDELRDLTDKLAECTLRAETSGTVTSLNATVGSVCSGTVATIQDTESLKIAITIEEADVPNVALGMTARITSDATEEEIGGTLTQLSPTASGAEGGMMGGGSGGFSAEVTVNGGSHGLRIGMNAKVEIIRSATEDVFTVPYNAVGTAEDGSRYVMVKTGGEGADATFEPVPVTTGAENDYYIEIRGEALSEGMEIRASATEDSVETTDDPSAMMGGGMMGGLMGNMPGSMTGGGNMPGGGMGGGRPQGGSRGGM